MPMLLRGLRVVAVVLLVCTGCLGQQAAEPPLLPLNETEKKIDPRALLAGQPDFTATENYFSAREISGFSAVRKVARKGKQYRFDTGVVVFILELNKPTIKVNRDRTYEEGVGNHEPYVSATNPLNPTDLLGFADLELTAVGAVELDGARLLKIKAKSKEFPQDVFLFADLSKKNLITIVQVVSSQRWGTQRMVDISFDVPSALFDLTGSNPQPKFTWKKIENAKVSLRGKPISDALVFRHGDYLFVHAGEFEHFFIDLHSNTALTVVYRGLLLAKSGRYIWQTKENEAISIGEPASVMKGNNEYRVGVRSTLNSVIVPDHRDKKDTLIKVEW